MRKRGAWTWGVIGWAACALMAEEQKDFSFLHFLPTGQRQQKKVAETPWPRSVLISDSHFEEGLSSALECTPQDPAFGSAHYFGAMGFVVPGAAALGHTPLTLRARTKIRTADRFNIVAAFEPKTSPAHWELYSFQGDGTLAFYMPGNVPDTIRS